MKIRKTVEEFAIITVGTIIVAIAVFFFMLPSHVSVGSGAALAMVLSNFIPLSVSTITLIMNVGLLIIGFLLIGPEFCAKTVYCYILMPLVMGVFEKIFPNFQSITQDPLLDVICYILVVGVGLAILFSRNASSGGLDIVAKIMNKYQLHSGATLNEIIGAYDRTPRMEMVTIVDKNEYKKLMDYVRKIDPKAFVTVYSVSDMRYQPKK